MTYSTVTFFVKKLNDKVNYNHCQISNNSSFSLSLSLSTHPHHHHYNNEILLIIKKKQSIHLQQVSVRTAAVCLDEFLSDVYDEVSSSCTNISFSSIRASSVCIA